MESTTQTSSLNDKAGPTHALLGTVGVLALLSASCCILPIGLSIIGLGGAWLLVLEPFVAYRVPIVIGVGLILVWAWLRLFRRWHCAKRRRTTLALLIFATLSFAIAASAPYWEDDVTRSMFAFWRSSQS